MYFTLYASREEAFAALAAEVKKTRWEYSVEMTEERPLPGGALAPCHRRTAAETARWAEADRFDPPLQWDGMGVRGVELRAVRRWSDPEMLSGFRAGFAWPAGR